MPQKPITGLFLQKPMRVWSTRGPRRCRAAVSDTQLPGTFRIRRPQVLRMGRDLVSAHDCFSAGIQADAWCVCGVAPSADKSKNWANRQLASPLRRPTDGPTTPRRHLDCPGPRLFLVYLDRDWWPPALPIATVAAAPVAGRPPPPLFLPVSHRVLGDAPQ